MMFKVNKPFTYITFNCQRRHKNADSQRRLEKSIKRKGEH